MKLMRRLLRSNEGFTLIELMVVLLVLGILATIAVPRFADMKGKANLVKYKTELKQVQTALELYYAENNSYPTDDTAFEAALPDYITSNDINKYSFAYTFKDDKYEIEVSLIADGTKIVNITRGDITEIKK